MFTNNFADVKCSRMSNMILYNKKTWGNFRENIFSSEQKTTFIHGRIISSRQKWIFSSLKIYRLLQVYASFKQ